ncbi:MAG TPA: class I SAM-dependent methyltransferase, partial [Chthoniobacterales bacterium]
MSRCSTHIELETRVLLASDHEEACARVASLFHERWLHHYVGSKLRTDYVFRAADQLLGPSSLPLLDVGCGVGLLPLYLRARGRTQEIVALDIDERKVRRARQAAADGYDSIDFIEHDARKALPDFLGNVALLDVLHYLPRERQTALL